LNPFHSPLQKAKKKSLVWLQVPPEALLIQRSPDTRATHPKLRKVEEKSAGTADSGVRVKFVLYDNSKFFRGHSFDGINSMPVVAASVGNGSVENLTQPVTYYMESDDVIADVKPVCVYWDETGG